MESMNRITKKILFKDKPVYVVTYYESDYLNSGKPKQCIVMADNSLDAMQKLKSHISENIYIESIESTKRTLYHEAGVVDNYHYLVLVEVKGSSIDPYWKVYIPYKSNPNISQLSSDIKDMLSQFQRNVTSVKFKIGDIKSQYKSLFKVITK